MKYIYKYINIVNFCCLLICIVIVSGEVKAQTVCPGVDHENGWFRLDVTYPDDTFVGTQFTGGLYGSLESTSFGVMSDLDWLYNDGDFLTMQIGPIAGGPGTSTTQTATAQVVTWWTQNNSRNTYVQYTNNADAFIQSAFIGIDAFENPLPLGVHVQIYDENCLEVINFCDFYTPKDTHVYNLGDLVTNAGQSIGTASLQGKEGFMTITPVVNCGTDDRAIEFLSLYGTVRIIDTPNDTEYGVNTWNRQAVRSYNEVEGTCLESVDEFNGAVGGGQALILNGEESCRMAPLEPSQLRQNFALVGEGPATDLVLFSFGDVYNNDVPEIGYQAAPATARYLPDIFDDEENLLSCPPIETCYIRLGVNDVLPISEDFVAPTPEPTPTPDPSPTSEPTPDPGDTTGGDGGDGGGCTVASTVTTATTSANLLLILIPLAGTLLIRKLKRGMRII